MSQQVALIHSIRSGIIVALGVCFSQVEGGEAGKRKFSLTTINHNLYWRRGNTGHRVRKREDDD